MIKNQVDKLNIVEQIKKDILQGHFQQGQKLKIDALKNHYCTSITPVREALNQLVNSGLVELAPNKGFAVAKLALAELSELLNTWSYIVERIFEIAFKIGDDDWEANILSAYHKLHKLELKFAYSDQEYCWRWATACNHYFSQIMSGCDAKWLLKVEALLYLQLERYRYLRLSQNKDMKKFISIKRQAHTNLLEAILARDTSTAIKLVKEQNALTLRELTEVISSGN